MTSGVWFSGNASCGHSTNWTKLNRKTALTSCSRSTGFCASACPFTPMANVAISISRNHVGNCWKDVFKTCMPILHRRFGEFPIQTQYVFSQKDFVLLRKLQVYASATPDGHRLWHIQLCTARVVYPRNGRPHRTGCVVKYWWSIEGSPDSPDHSPGLPG